MASLLRTEAETRGSLLQISSVEVELDLRDAEEFASTSVIEFSASEEAVQTFIDFHGNELLEVELNGEQVPLDRWADGRIAITVAHRNRLVVRGKMVYGNDGEGLHQHLDPADGRRYLYAMSFLDAAPRWFPCFDQPDLKAPYAFTVRTPQEWTVAGNSPAEQTSPGLWRLAPSKPLSTYFVSLIAGEWATVIDEHDGIPLGVHCRQSLAGPLAAEAEDILDVTRKCFDAYHELFGIRYPFEEYHQAFVPDFNAGAMENPGLVTFRDQFIFRAAATRDERGVRANTIAHEMAHQWFGDLVTMRWWDDLWLNESFAEFMANRVCSSATEYDTWPDFSLSRKDWGSIADQAPSTHPVAGNGAADTSSALASFDGISYAKGAAVLGQLLRFLGEDVFHAGLASYFTEHRFGNATLADLIRAWEDASGEKLQGWVAAWLQTTGLDRLEIDARGSPARLTCTAPPEQSAARRHAIDVATLDPDGTVIETQAVIIATGETQDLILAREGAAAWIPDSSDTTWARIRPAPGWPELPALSSITDLSVRVLLVNSIRDGVRSAELAPEIAFELLLAQLSHETNVLLLSAIADFCSTELSGAYCPRAERAARLTRFASVAETLLAAAEPGSDHQLAVLRVWFRATSDSTRLSSLLRGDEEIDGRPLDEELRWAVVWRLCVLTGAESLITEEIGIDHSASGLAHAARCRASLPTLEAKLTAWRLLVRPSTLSAYELYASAAGFFLAEQDELTEDFVPLYFEQINATAVFRRGWALAEVAAKLFPRHANRPEVSLMAAAACAESGLNSAIRRALIDGADALRRAVAAIEPARGAD